ncbi:MAG: DUF3098 domain-containing protein [Saprospiraceae bacterium]
MAKQQPQQRRPNQPQAQAGAPAPQPKKAAPVRGEKKESLFSTGSNELIFGRQNFLWMGIGLALVVIGLALMSGGSMPSPDVWDESIIYSFRRITLAPIVMVAGFVAVIVGIFKSNNTPAEPENTPAADA